MTSDGSSSPAVGILALLLMTLENAAVSEWLQGYMVGSRLLVFAEAEAERQGYDEILL